MSSEGRASFDVMCGGNTEVPSGFSLRQFGAPRMEEILMLSEAINDPPAKGQLFQRLPKHMRRRQMSHHESRLPRKFRSSIETQNKDPPSKRPSRKFRRKPKNLLTEYNRRKRLKIWLETHIWHAKRFHMIERWGYRLPESSVNKGFRANYRACKSHCLLIDMSFMACIELTGPEPILVAGLNQCSNPACGLTFAAQAFIGGTREGSLYFYHANSYPYHVIGNVTFMWKPKTEETTRTIWLWVHPAYHDEIVECLAGVFNLKICEPEMLSAVPKWSSENVIMVLLKDKLNRFRLVGPLASCVLGDTFTIAPLPKEAEVVLLNDENTADIELSIVGEVKKSKDPRNVLKECKEVLQKIYSKQDWAVSWEKQSALVSQLSQTPASLFPFGSILGLLVTDPRLSMPPQRTKSIFNTQGNSLPKWSPQLGMSVIWDESARNAVTSSLLSDWQVNQMQASRVVRNPQASKDGALIPILLIQQPGCQGQSHNGFGSGWDVIIPSGWALPFWRSFYLRGARTGGLRETSLLRLESNTLRTALQPDSKAGCTSAIETQQALREKYFKWPPAKRPNYIKLGVFEPFTPPWKDICEGELFVVRDFSLLRQLAQAVKDRKTAILEGPQLGLVAVSVQCAKGRPEQLARLYLPKEEDLKCDNNLEEPSHPDPNSVERTENKIKNKLLLRQWKQDRKRKKNGEEPVWKDEDVAKLRNEARDLLQKSWLPKTKELNVRELAGCVTQADFSFSEGSGCAQGYITLKALVSTLELSAAQKKPPMLLLRNLRHLRYHQASFRVLLD